MRNISNLISVRGLPALAPIAAHQHLSLCLLNACSVKNKTADFFYYICDFKADLVAITGTWLTTDDAAVRAELCPVGYKISDRPRTGRRGGGVGLIYRDSLFVRWIDAGEKESFEYSEWTISSPSLNLRLVLLYRPPFSADHRVSTNNFFMEFSTYLETLLLYKQHLVIAGDFNIHVNVPHDPDSANLLDLLQFVGLQQHITEPTHIQDHILDLIITRSSDNIINGTPVIDHFISNHASVYCTLLPDKPSLTTKNVAYRKLNSVELESLKRDLSVSLLCSDRLNLHVHSHTEDPCNLDALVCRYNTTLSRAIDCHAPLKTKTVKVRPSVPWYNDRTKAAKHLRLKAERTWRRTRSLSDLNIFKSYRNRVTYLMNQARQTFYTKFIDENSTDHKRLFRATKQLLAKKEELSFPNYQDKSKLADDISIFFVRKINRIRSDIDSVDIDLSLRNALPPDQEVDAAHAFHSFQPLSENAVFALIRKSAKGLLTRYDFVACDKLTTGLRHDLFRVNQTYNLLTTPKSCRRPVLSLSHATKSYRVNRP